ncbi:MAG: hypothetical protein EDM05_027925 [Leptolyngbya sp. IPPAS B-1204]|uniref:Uncharacterized protein n=1 Tax=Leptolyngbya sp. NK1-12 TaxID=2547451 RepID=A0AA96WCQ9_9CYAN|nr:hypothetical protein [Leptolyngbya sp. NK1-12]MBF2049765.1 hypothetical protein [Elainella sp. C42_A2020_010]WNZ22744.1 hypothetical protein HJG54_07675 [Leptolyngbya sp. NK1-12]
MNAIDAPVRSWDTHLYEQNHAFVWQCGEDLVRLLAWIADYHRIRIAC